MAEKAKTSAELFTQLNALNVNDKTEQKQGLTYLSWSWAWAELSWVELGRVGELG